MVRDRVLLSPQRPSITAQTETVRVGHLHNPPGAGRCHFEASHALFLSLASRPVPYVQTQAGQTFRGLYRPGEMLITPAKTPLELRWEGEENCVQIELSAAFVGQVANETLKQNGDRVQLMPTFQVKNAQMEAIARLLFTESQQTPTANQLYLDSLANVLAVELLRHHATTQPLVPTYEGGLPLYQLQQVLDYIDAHLTENLQLATLAQLLDLSQFHFSRLFKQSLGISPYQYLIQQRVERAQQLLQGRDRAITDIALDCGFSSSSHLSKQFRQVTGMTPTAYRAHCHPKGLAVK